MINRPLTSASPRASVIIPTLPDRDHSETVRCLAEQTVSDIEVLIIDDEDIDICEARNIGLRESAADIVLFTDDDTQPPDTWVAAAVEELGQTEAAILEGPVFGGIKNNKHGMYLGCNIAVRRDAALAVDGFDSTLAGWRDDTDFGWRVEKAYDGKWCSEMTMVHPPTPNSSFDAELERILRERHPTLYEDRVRPDGVLERVNHWLWRRGFWDFIDEVRA